MNCWHCNEQLIWASDLDLEADEPGGDDYVMVTFLHCPNCRSHVEVFYPKEINDEQDDLG